MTSNEQPLVGVNVGSKSDWETMRHAAEVMAEFGVPCESRVVSAHRPPQWMCEYASTVEAIIWALTEARVSTLTLIGHSRSATVPIEQLGGPLGLLERMRLEQERLAASKLKLKDDVARFARNSQIARMLSNRQITLHGLFYIQESGVFLKYDLEAGDFAPLGETISY